MFENRWAVQNAGVKYKKNPMYELQDIRIIKEKDIPTSIKEDRYGELVEPEFVGKLIIVYDKDNVGQSGGNAQWCYVYDCDHGNVKYKGIAIHKCVDLDNMEQNYNEKLFSVLAGLVFDKNNIRFPNIDLVKNEDWPEDKPAVLSYFIVKKDPLLEIDEEEMLMMKTIAFNVMERQEIHDNRISLSKILDSVRIQVMKKARYVKDYAKEELDKMIMHLAIGKQIDKDRKDEYDERERILTIIYNNIDGINSETTLESFLGIISEELGREFTPEDLDSIKIGDISVLDILKNVKTIFVEKQQKYRQLEKSIIHTTVIDLMTNNIDRHLTNWSLIRNKKTDEYILGLFDHATNFYNMSLANDSLAMPQDYLKQYWATSSVLTDAPLDLKLRSSKGIDLFKYLMEHHREDTLEMLQILHDKLPEFEKMIGYETIPNAEYDKLSQEEKDSYFKSELDTIIKPKKILDGLKSKFRRISRDYEIDFDDPEQVKY